MTDAKSHFAFLGFEFWWMQSSRTRNWFPYARPRPKKVRAVLRAVRDELRVSRHLGVQDAVKRVNPIVRGWANYFRHGNSARALGSVKFHVERKVRRFAAKQRGRRGFGWERWSSEVVYGQWGLFNDYHVSPAPSFAKARANRTES
jgi:RNA-directed DNA polymerase